MSEENTPIPEELQAKLDEIELNAEDEAKKLPRFDMQKALLTGVCCLGLGFTFGIAMRIPVATSGAFGILIGLVGFVTGGCQRPKKK